MAASDSELPGFSGYHLIETGNGVLSSFGLFETSEQADESKTVVPRPPAVWVGLSKDARPLSQRRRIIALGAASRRIPMMIVNKPTPARYT